MKGIARHYSFEAIGTVWAIVIETAVEAVDFAALRQAIRRRIEAFDLAYSRFRADSLIHKIAAAAGEYTLPADAQPLLDLYQRLYHITKGKMTPLVGQALSDAGYDANYSLRPKRLHHTPAWEAALDYRFPVLTTTRPVLLDFGAAGKGYLVDIISEIIEDFGIDDYCVDGGGDMRQRNANGRSLKVSLEHPADPTLAAGVATLSNQSLCGSAGNKRAWGAYHHILDPQKGLSPEHIAAVWVSAQSTLLADGLATALFFADPAELQRHFSFEYAIMYADSSLETSDLFPAIFFTKQAVAYA